MSKNTARRQLFIVTKKLIPGRDSVTKRLNRNQPVYAVSEDDSGDTMLTMLVTLSPLGNGQRFRVPKEFLSAAA